MLVLSRRKEETIEFPDLGISVQVIRIDGNKVRLGIKAPDSIRILRGELVEAASEFDKPICTKVDKVFPLVPPVGEALGGEPELTTI